MSWRIPVRLRQVKLVEADQLMKMLLGLRPKLFIRDFCLQGSEESACLWARWFAAALIQSFQPLY